MLISTECAILATSAHPGAAATDDIAQIFEDRTTSFKQLDSAGDADGQRADRAWSEAAGAGRLYRHEFRPVLRDGLWLLQVEHRDGRGYWRSPPEVAYVLNDAGAEVLFVGAEFVKMIEPLKAELKTVKTFIAVDGPAVDWPVFDAKPGATGSRPRTRMSRSRPTTTRYSSTRRVRPATPRACS